MKTFRAGPGQARTIAGLLHDFNTEFESPVPAIDDLTRRFTVLLARDDVVVLLAGDVEAVGFAYLTLRPSPYFDGPLAQLEELYVRPDLRGEGIGTDLMSAALHELSARHCGEIHINVDEVDRDTRRFYERHGFSNTEPGTDDRMLCYVLELTG